MFKDNSSNKYDLKVVKEISLKLTTSIKRNVHSDLMLKYVLVYLGYIALDNKIDDNDQLNSFIDYNLSKSRSQFIKEIVQENIDVVFELTKLFKKNDLLTSGLTLSTKIRYPFTTLSLSDNESSFKGSKE